MTIATAIRRPRVSSRGGSRAGANAAFGLTTWSTSCALERVRRSGSLRRDDAENESRDERGGDESRDADGDDGLFGGEFVCDDGAAMDGEDAIEGEELSRGRFGTNAKYASGSPGITTRDEHVSHLRSGAPSVSMISLMLTR
jgi:hypothetical protein